MRRIGGLIVELLQIALLKPDILAKFGITPEEVLIAIKVMEALFLKDQSLEVFDEV